MTSFPRFWIILHARKCFCCDSLFSHSDAAASSFILFANREDRKIQGWRGTSFSNFSVALSLSLPARVSFFDALWCFCCSSPESWLRCDWQFSHRLFFPAEKKRVSKRLGHMCVCLTFSSSLSFTRCPSHSFNSFPATKTHLPFPPPDKLPES